MAVCLIVSHTHYVSASDGYFPKGKELFLDATQFSIWNDSYHYPYVYIYNNSSNHWIKMKKCNINGGNEYFSFIVPEHGYNRLIFALQNSDNGGWNQCNIHTVDICCSIKNNCYTFNGKSNEGKILGDWNYINISNLGYFPSGKQIFLNIANVSNWCNPYMYMFGPCGVNSWIKMEKRITDGENEYVGGIVPKGNYYGLIFTSQDGDICNFNNCNVQTVNILYDNYSNCYTLTNIKDSEYKMNVNWSHVDFVLQNNKQGDYKINIDSIYSNEIKVNSDGKIEYTADDGDLVTIKSKRIKNTSLIEMTSDNVKLTKKDDTYTFTMPAHNINIKAKYLFNKEQSFTGNIFWVDTQPSIDDSPIGLVKWTNRTGRGCRTNDYYTLYLPSGVDINNLPVYFGNSDQFTINGKQVQSGSLYSFNFNTEYTINNHKLKIMQGSSTSIYINTNEDLPIGIVSENYIPDKIYKHKRSIVRVNGQFMSVNENGKIVNEPQILPKISGRGDGSWSVGYQYFGKYPYNINLQYDADILNMGANKSKHFCLLANSVDESLLRVLEVYKAATDSNIPFTPHCTLADLYNSGEYLGSYAVIENIGIGNNALINDGETVEKYHNDKNATGKNVKDKYIFNGNRYDFQYTDIGSIDNGIDFTKKSYLIGHECIEKAQVEDCWFLSPCGQYVQIRYPKRLNKDEMIFISNKYAEAEEAVYSNNTDKMKDLMDLNSFALVYCLNEFTKQIEAGSTGYYIYYNGKYENPKLLAAPVWDYDWSLGGYRHFGCIDLTKYTSETNDDNDNPHGWFCRYKMMADNTSNINLPAKMCENENFWNYYVKNAWKQMKPVLDKVFGNKGTIDNDFNENKKSFEMNEARYGFLKTHPGYSCGSAITGSTPEEAYLYLKNFANARIKWMDDRLK